MWLYISAVLSLAAIGLLYFLWTSWKYADTLEKRFKPVIDVEQERLRVHAMLVSEQAKAEQELGRLRAQADRALKDARRELAGEKKKQREQLDALRTEESRALAEQDELKGRIANLMEEAAILEETAELREDGYYAPRYGFPTSSRYEQELDAVRGKQKGMIKDKSAVVCQVQWQVNGSTREGKKMMAQAVRLMLRAFNGETDAAIAKVRFGNADVMEERMKASRTALNKQGEAQSCVISAKYLDLKIQELHLVHEYAVKKHDEREEQKRLREQMREEERAAREIERALEEATEDADRFEEALRVAREQVATMAAGERARTDRKIAELERRLKEAEERRERAISRAQTTRSGHVYVISNIGSFGQEVYKIGMTRRLEPMDRVKELSNASVPFPFDVHAVIYADDAPALETSLHRRFTDRRINRVNEHKEFFRVSLSEIESAVHSMHGRVEFTHVAEARAYRQTMSLLGSGQPNLGVGQVGALGN